jgi:hypothetical protein
MIQVCENQKGKHDKNGVMPAEIRLIEFGEN